MTLKCECNSSGIERPRRLPMWARLRRIGHVALGALALVPATSPAGALYFYEMSNASESSYAGAGMTARANDAGTVFTNPAGMMRFDTPEMLAGATGVYIDAGFTTNANNTATGPSAGVNKRVVPAGSFSYIRPLNEKWSAGVSAHNYFGLAIDWPGDWVGRASSVNVTLLAPQLQPTVAYRVNDWLSVGAGAALTLGYMSEKLRQEALTPGSPDGKLRISDTDFAVQGNFGVMLEPWDHTRIGLRYLTETNLDFEDDPDTSWRDPLGQALGDPDTDLELGVTMPQEVQFSVYHQWDGRLNLLGSVGWAEISQFGRVQVDIDDNGIPGTTVDADFRDVWNFGVGAEYQWKPDLQVTAGFHVDTSMSTDRTRPIPIPLGTLYRYAVGFKHQRGNGMTLGGGLTWIYEGNLPVAETSAGTAGKYSNVSLWIASVYAKW
jgi:long-chain fatty acid transport protein